MRHAGCEMISLEDSLYIVRRQNDHCALAKKNDNSTVSPPYPHVPHLWIQPIVDQKYLGRYSQKFQKAKLAFVTLWQLLT